MPQFECAVADCRAHTKKQKRLDKYPWMKDLTFHSFPHKIHQKRLRRQWINACKRNDLAWEPNVYSRVCSLHFAGQLPKNGDYKHKIKPILFAYNEWGSKYIETEMYDVTQGEQQSVDEAPPQDLCPPPVCCLTLAMACHFLEMSQMKLSLLLIVTNHVN